MVRNMFAASAAILLALIFFALAPQRTFAQGPVCGDLRGGLLKDCGFDGFYGDEGAGSGVWKIFYLNGNPGVGLHPVEGWPKGPSVWLKGNFPFDAGIYQQVAVTPGKGYRLTIPFAVVSFNGKQAADEDNKVNRRLGIDPYGGTDVRSPNVKWSADYFGRAKVAESIDFDEYARANVITVFIRVTNPFADRDVDVFLDSPALIENTDMTPIQVAPPTSPATAPPPPTARPTREPTEIPEATEVPPTDTPEPTAEPTDLPTATLAPTNAPRPTRARVAQVEPATRPTRARLSDAQGVDGSDNSAPSTFELGTLGVIGLVGVTGAVVMVAAAAFLLLRRK